MSGSMTDASAIREALTVLYSRLVDEGYAPQFGEPDPADLFKAAQLALDRMEGVGQSQHSMVHGVDFYLEQVPEYRRLKAENARLREELRKIAKLDPAPGITTSTHQRIALRALGKEEA